MRQRGATMAVKPLNWTSWREARDRMPEIWDGWRFQLKHADEAMVNALRRGHVSCRGPDGVENGGSRVRLADILPALKGISLSSQMAGVRYTKPVSALCTIGYLQPTLVESESEATARFPTPELAWDEFRAELIRFGLPARPNYGRRKSKGRPAKPFWQEARVEAMRWLDEYGYPSDGDGEQANLEKHITDWLGARGHYPVESTVRLHVGDWISEYRASLYLTH
jgi:hypothetical protein